MIKDFPKKTKKLRIKYGFTQKQIAYKLGVSPSIVSGYETGERTPSTENLLALSYIFNCSTDYLLGKNNAEPGIVLNTDGLTDEQKQALQNLIHTIRKN